MIDPDRKKILVFRTGHLGDTVVALPALWAIRRFFPDASITLLTNDDRSNPGYPSAASVLPKQGLIDEWLTYPSGGSAVGKAAGSALLAAQLRRNAFDTLLYLMPRMRSEQQIARDERFFRLAGIKNIRCLDYFRRHSLPLVSAAPISRTDAESEFLLNALRSEGVSTDGATFDLALTAPEIGAADAWLAEHVEDSSPSLVAIAPGSKWPSKIWAEDRYTAVVDRLMKDFGCTPVIVGGPEDREKGERMLARWGRGANAAGALSVRSSAALLQRSRLYLGNDTGVMHLAAAVGTPCVAIFAAVDRPGRWEPVNTRHTVLRRSVDCEGCHSPTCPHGNKCLDLITIDDVYDACIRILSEAPR